LISDISIFNTLEVELMSSIDKTLLSGSMGTMLLKLLSEKDMYGYEMIDTLRSRSQNVFELKAGTLYPLLHSFEEKNYLTSYEHEVAGKVRKYYSITDHGRKYLKSKLDEWETYSVAVANVLAPTGI
jgi:DNA-binding PadR family transcriptional regulator